MFYFFLQPSLILILVRLVYSSNTHPPFKHFLYQLFLRDDSTFWRVSPPCTRCDVTSAVGFIYYYSRPTFAHHQPFFFPRNSSSSGCTRSGCSHSLSISLGSFLRLKPATISFDVRFLRAAVWGYLPVRPGQTDRQAWARHRSLKC